MPLVKTESLGYVSVDPSKADKPLVIPASAVLATGGRKAGSRAVVYVEIDPSLLQPSEKQMVEDLVAAAINDARTKADAASNEEMAKMTSGLPLPPGFKLPF